MFRCKSCGSLPKNKKIIRSGVNELLTTRRWSDEEIVAGVRLCDFCGFEGRVRVEREEVTFDVNNIQLKNLEIKWRHNQDILDAYLKGRKYKKREITGIYLDYDELVNTKDLDNLVQISDALKVATPEQLKASAIFSSFRCDSVYNLAKINNDFYAYVGSEELVYLLSSDALNIDTGELRETVLFIADNETSVQILVMPDLRNAELFQSEPDEELE
jgi:hypothetical protein